jgi:predicted hydrocarbon binding protein
MHGLIFSSLRDYLALHDGTPGRELMRDEPTYSISEAYPDEQFEAFVGRACAALDVERGSLLRDLGYFTASRTFAGLYPALFTLSSTTREFLLTVERPIHEVVRAAIPNALPPKLEISPLDQTDVKIVYSSERQLCELLRGLVEGTAAHYGEVARLEESTCMHRGDRACTFRVRLDGRPVSRGTESHIEARAPGVTAP